VFDLFGPSSQSPSILTGKRVGLVGVYDRVLSFVFASGLSMAPQFTNRHWVTAP